MQHCYNRGCGQSYDPETNNDSACRHHPGAPYFHDAYKGWSCCKKKSVDFTEFLSIKGCTLSKHSNIKPAEPEKPTKQNGIEEEKEIQEELTVIRKPIDKPMDRPPINSQMVRLEPTVAASLKTAVDTLLLKAPTAEATSTQNTTGELSVGTACKNSGCTYSYTATETDTGTCSYHPGVPIFHEGLKYWSCCKRKTTDFAVFMAQRGCVNGSHQWFKQNEGKKAVQCRYDWHQTASDVIVSIYAKMYHYATSRISVNPIRLQVSIMFPAQSNAKFELDLELRGIIDVSKSSVQMYGSKVEITMSKAEPGHWPKLDLPTAKLDVMKEDFGADEKQSENSDFEDALDLDDIETVNVGLHLSEMAQNTKKDFN